MKLLKPDISVDSLSEIDIAFWKRRGIRCILVDLDNTVAPWRKTDMTDEARQLIAQCRDAAIMVVLFTNAPEKRAREAAWKAGISYYAPARKPFLFRYRKAIAELGVSAAETMAVGDQIFTDILGGNLMGCATVLTSPLSATEYRGTKLLRFLEKHIAGRKLVFRDETEA